MKLKELFTDESNWHQEDLHHSIIRCYPIFSKRMEVLQKMMDELKTTSLIQWIHSPDRTFQEIKDLVNKLDI